MFTRLSSRRRSILAGALFLATAALSVPTISRAAGQSVQLVHAFHTFADGVNPSTRMAQTADGTIYGTTLYGGIFNSGTAFKISPTGLFQTLYNFGSAPSDPVHPMGALAIGSDGAVYGASEAGGLYGKGGIFKITASGDISLVYSFGLSIQDCNSPITGLMYHSADGKLYGTSAQGGANGSGGVFQISADGSESVVLNFTQETGSFPVGPPTFKPADGRFYLRMGGGGSMGSGTILKFSSTGSYSVIDVTDARTGRLTPGQLMLASDGNLYGTTYLDDGTQRGSILKVTKDSAGIVYTFPGGNTGAYPWTQLTSANDGFLYGATTSYVYRYAPGASAVTPIYNFSFSNGDSGLPINMIQGADGALYGGFDATGNSGYGSIFKLTTSGVKKTIVDFDKAFQDGVTPLAPVLLGADGAFYGVTYAGGRYGKGVIYRQTLEGKTSILYHFGNDFTIGNNPIGGLVQAKDGTFYGSTLNYGAIYKFTISGNPITAVVKPIYTLNIEHGVSPRGALITGLDDNLYGTLSGGSSGGGNVFKITPGGVFTVLLDFTSAATGLHPYCTLTQGANGTLYGTTLQGGVNDQGTVFALTPAGALLWTRALTAAQGVNPRQGLAFGSDGNLYGTASAGGASGLGSVFKVTTAGVVSSVYSFTASSGNRPYSSLTLGPDGILYGATTSAGPGGKGTLYQIKNGAASVIYSFDGVSGANTATSLTFGPDGNFYGTAQAGAAGNSGSIFLLDVNIPAISRFNATAGKGVTIVILGTNFATATGVAINGAPASFTVLSDTRITTVVPAGAAPTGNITVTTPTGSSTKGTFTVAPTPTMTGIHPGSGHIGAAVTLTGTNFTGVTSFLFNGKPAQFTVASPTLIYATVPQGATTGPVKITSPGGTATSSISFQVTP